VVAVLAQRTIEYKEKQIENLKRLATGVSPLPA